MTGYLFAALAVIYPKDYQFDIDKTPENAQIQKRSQAKILGKYTIEEIDKGLEFVREQKRNGESRYLRLDVDLVVGAIRQANRKVEAQQMFKPLPPPTLTKEQRRAELARVRAEVGL